MKKKYCIGFFVALFVFVSLLGIGYQVSYQHALDLREAKSEMPSKTKSISTKGEAVKNEGYYLCELQGFIVVYLSDKSTIYEFTEIPLTDLPEEVQQEIHTGKHIETEKELYAFLENYSS